MKVRYAIGGILLAALLLFPAGAAAGKGGQGGQVPSLAARQCAQERAEFGKKAFLKRYGQKRAMRNCLKRTQGQVATALPPASTDCQDELADETVAAFIDDYGDDVTSSLDQAMQDCVAEGVDALLNPDDYVDDGTDVEE